MKKPCKACEGTGIILQYSSMEEYFNDPAVNKSIFTLCSECKGFGYIDKEADNLMKGMQIVSFISLVVPLCMLVWYIIQPHGVPKLVWSYLNVANLSMILVQWFLGYRLSAVRKKNRQIDSITEELIK